MKIKQPKALGKLRYMEYTDIAAELQRQRVALMHFQLPVLSFGAVVCGLLIVGCIVYQRPWTDWLLVAFMAFGTALSFFMTDNTLLLQRNPL